LIQVKIKALARDKNGCAQVAGKMFHIALFIPGKVE